MFGYALFDTAIGRCGILWGPYGVVGVQLPEGSDSDTRTRLLRHRPTADEAAPPREIQRGADEIVALLGGQKRSLRAITLDMNGLAEFNTRVYETARAIPPGRTRTYGEIARAIGAPGAARAVGQAMGRNPFPIVVPCHRVLAAGDAMGGFSARGGVATKLRLLEIEGWKPQPTLFDALL